MRVKQTALVIALTISVSGVAAAATSQRPDKQPSNAATTASVHGTRFVYGPYTIIPGASYGVAGLGYAVAKCPRGQHATGGGWDSTDTTSDLVIVTSNEASRGLAGWLVAFRNLTENTTGFLVRATVVCA